MRLFVAVDLDDARRLAASRLAKEISRRLGVVGVGRGVKWVAAPNLHLTIRFIGEVDAVRGLAIQDALRPPLLAPAFDVTLGEAGLFPRAGAPRVLWAGVVQGASGLADLHDEIDGRLRQIGEPASMRPLAAHLTLARFRDLDRRLGAALGEAIRGARIDAGPCRIETVTLYESRLAPMGPTYVPLVISPLARAGM